MSVASDPSPEVEATLSGSDWWLKDPFDPEQNRRVFPEGDTVDINMRKDMSVFRPVGRKYPVVIRGVVRSQDFPLTLGTITPQEAWDIEELWEYNRTLLLQSPMAERGDQWYVEMRDAERVILNTNDPWQRYNIQFVEVERPEDD